MTADRPFATIEVTDPELAVGGVVHATVMSRALGRRADCTFWAPPVGDRPLPLVVLLHGVYGSHWAWIGQGAADRAARDLIAGGRVPPFAMAMPSDGLIGHGSGYVVHPDADVPAWILDEVPVLASLALGGVDAGHPIALAGLSMGGFGALRLAAVAGERVAAAAGLSSITELSQLALFGAEVPGGAAVEERSVVDAIRSNRAMVPPLWIECGVEDPLIEPNRRLHEELVADGVAHAWAERAGNHEWRYWRTHLPAALEFVAGHLATSR
ncbi:MAG: alpha/beta hydrolase [Ilumatobacteraceae bacterium]